MASSTSSLRPPLRCSQSTEKSFQIIFHISLYHLTTLDHREHECIMICRYFTFYFAGILQVHLYPTLHLLSQVVWQFNISTFQHPLHRRPLANSVLQCFLQQLASSLLSSSFPLPAFRSDLRHKFFPLQLFADNSAASRSSIDQTVLFKASI